MTTNLSASLALVAVLSSWAVPVAAEATFPNQPVRLLVGYSPGGPTDILARQVAPALEKALGQSVIVENRPGASGNIAGMEVVRAKPDGYTLLMGDLTLATNPSLMKQMPFDPLKALTPIAPLATAPLVLVVNPSFPANSLKELVSYAQANPGKVSNGTAGSGNLTHLAGEVLKRAVDMDIQQVPYKGSGPALTDLVGNQISMVVTGLSSAKGFIEGKRLKALAITGTARSPKMPEIPTFSEASGLPLPELNLGSWWGVFAPANVPEPVAEALNQAVQRALTDPDLRARLAEMNIDPRPGSRADMGKLLKDETQTWDRVIKQAGIQPQ